MVRRREVRKPTLRHGLATRVVVAECVSCVSVHGKDDKPFSQVRFIKSLFYLEVYAMSFWEFLMFNMILDDDDEVSERTPEISDYDYLEDIDSDWEPLIAEEDFEDD